MTRIWFFIALIFPLLGSAGAGESHNLVEMERSFWVHASLAHVPQKGYWGTDFPSGDAPTKQNIQNAAKLLTGRYAANRLYLIYHHEISLQKAQQVFKWWREQCPMSVELIPTLVLRMYDKQQTEVFSAKEITQLTGTFRRSVNDQNIAIYDIYSNRDQGTALKQLQRQYPNGIVRIGIQPTEKLSIPYVGFVQDTWSGFCHGKTNIDWQDRGFGRDTLRKWVRDRNQSPHAVTWNLIVVAWDYSTTKRGSYPGYDDAEKNMPLPAGRNLLAMNEILRQAKPNRITGFSSDLFILQINSQSKNHDRLDGSFYETLRRGDIYRGHYSVPFQEVTKIFANIRAGRVIETP
jgi:hypothetical protein